MATIINPIRAGLALAKQMRSDNTHPINAMYIEYKNVASPGDTVTVPGVTNQQGLEYYNALASPSDFLRVPTLGNPALSIASGYTPYFGVGEGNTLTILAITADTVGILGRLFDNANNSKVYGLALVCAPTWSDRTKDILFQRIYFTAGSEQVLRPSSGSFSVSYPLTFGV